jgi:hypothetical protein
MDAQDEDYVVASQEAEEADVVKSKQHSARNRAEGAVSYV